MKTLCIMMLVSIAFWAGHRYGYTSGRQDAHSMWMKAVEDAAVSSLSYIPHVVSKFEFESSAYAITNGLVDFDGEEFQ